MQSICASPPMLFSSTFGLYAFALIRLAEKSLLLIGSMSAWYSPPAFFRFLMNPSCNVWPYA